VLSNEKFKIMRHYLLLIPFFTIIFTFTFCSNQPKTRSEKDTGVPKETKHKMIPYVNTICEIKVYNDFIDEVYNVYKCHLDLDSPQSYLKYHDNVTKEEYKNYKKQYELNLNHFNEMLDTSKITAFVADSLYGFKISSSDILSELDSLQKISFNYLISDTITMASAAFNLDSLKSKKIYFERPSYIYVDWDKMPTDTALKYSDQNQKYWSDHVAHQIDGKYYIGSISMSRVKFNQDSSLCFLECGYTAQSKCGYGYYYFLKRTKGRWIVFKKNFSWIS
jgi:hypothetical protein